MNLCQYKNIFGKPGKGVHSFRIFNIAIVDTLLAGLLGYGIWKVFNWNPYYIGIGVFLSGIFFHWIFCVKTTINGILGL
jgi:hypothetical protein